MSEYQFVGFRAVDRPVTTENLAYMRQQSSRAKITPWSFENEYHYGDFRGDTLEMLRRGYDVHLHYADFGIRNLLIRLPNGLPNKKTAQPYLKDRTLRLNKDKQGAGVILEIIRFCDPGELEQLLDVDELFNDLLEIRAEIIDGDLRPLYLAHLAVASDLEHEPDETFEAPVPAGLECLSDSQKALAEFFELDDDLIAAAAQKSPAVSSAAKADAHHLSWVQNQKTAIKDEWLVNIISGDSASVRAEILAKYQLDYPKAPWPTAEPRRTVTQLLEIADGLAAVAREKAVADAARERDARLKKMAANPSATLRDTERLVTLRTGDAYIRVANLLAELREALSGSNQSEMPEKQAQKLRDAYPKLNLLKSKLRERGFLQE